MSFYMCAWIFISVKTATEEVVKLFYQTITAFEGNFLFNYCSSIIWHLTVAHLSSQCFKRAWSDCPTSAIIYKDCTCDSSCYLLFSIVKAATHGALGASWWLSWLSTNQLLPDFMSGLRHLSHVDMFFSLPLICLILVHAAKKERKLALDDV